MKNVFPTGTFNDEKDYLATKVPNLYIQPTEHLIDLPYKKLYNDLLQKAIDAAFAPEEPPRLGIIADEKKIAKIKTELIKLIDESFPPKTEEEKTEE